MTCSSTGSMATLFSTATILLKDLLPHYNSLVEGHPILATSIATWGSRMQLCCRDVLPHHVPFDRIRNQHLRHTLYCCPSSRT